MLETLQLQVTTNQKNLKKTKNKINKKNKRKNKGKGRQVVNENVETAAPVPAMILCTHMRTDAHTGILICTVRLQTSLDILLS